MSRRDLQAKPFSELYLEYRPRVMRTCVGLLGNIEDAQDAVQEAFLRAARSFDTFRLDADFLPWIISIAVHVCYDLLRRRQRRPDVSLDSLEYGRESVEPSTSDDQAAPDPEDAAYRNWLVSQVRHALQSLPFDERLIVEEFYLEDGSSRMERVQLLCQILNCSPRTVYNRLQSAKRRLRDRFLEKNLMEFSDNLQTT